MDYIEPDFARSKILSTPLGDRPTRRYNLRMRQHDRQLTRKSLHIGPNDFILWLLLLIFTSAKEVM